MRLLRGNMKLQPGNEIISKYKKDNRIAPVVLFVELLGFEPRQTEPKSVVLPLHHSSITKTSPIFRQGSELGVQK